MHFFARFLLILGAVLVLQLTSVGADSAEICKWLGDHNGHYCDSAAERWIWRKWNFLKSGATDCNSFCANNPKKNFKGGHCKSAANYDTSSWCGKGQMTEPLLGFLAAKPPVERNIHIFDTEVPHGTEEKKEEFAENIIVSSRYTPWNFLPKSMLEQFRRLANVYFLIIGMIAVVGSYSNYYETAVEPAGILGPMIIVVLISVIKDGIEDVKRHNQDAKINAQLSHKVSEKDGSIFDAKWRDLHVGDTIVLFGDEEVPADVVVLACGGVQGPTCYVETAAIDGETNLKMKNPCLVTGLVDSKHEAAAGGKSTIESLCLSEDRKTVLHMPGYIGTNICAEVPNGSIHRFNGFIQLCPAASRSSVGRPPSTTSLGSAPAAGSPAPLPVVGQEQRTLTEKNLLLRGSVLRATEWAICTVTYTGADTKLSLNSKQTPSKLSSVDRIVNRTLVVAITVMILVCLISMVFGIVWENDDKDAKYLCLDQSDLDERYPNGGGCENGSTSSILTIFTFATLYNNFVCISMYVSLELVYLCQSYFLCNDLNLYDETTDTPAECHTSGMCADLGQIKYVLSDKTGTLTKNLMVVQHFSIADRVFGDPISVGGEDVDASFTSTGMKPRPSSIKHSPSNPTLRSSNNTQAASSQTSNSPLHEEPAAGGDSSRHTSMSGTSYSGTSRSSSLEQVASLTALSLIQQMPKVTRTTPEDAAISESWLRRQFVRVLVYCNTAMLMPNASGSVSITDLSSLKSSLNAESPDEVALIVAAAQHCGALLTVRNGNSMESRGMERYAYNSVYANSTFNTAGAGGASVPAITTPVDGSASSFQGPTERIELLAVNEFDSDRKMMSVLVRYTDIAGPCAATGTREDAPKSRIFLLCKGADSSVLKYCRRDGTAYTTVCMQHIENFANTGLRTLVAACKIIPEEVATAWLKDYKAAGNSIQQRGELLSACAKQIERDMVMLGAIGIEDELQDGVPEAIGTLHEAGVNVWMITGDKAETGLAIGKKCNLINLQRQELERIVNLSDEALRLRVTNLHNYVFLRKQREEKRRRDEERANESAWWSAIKAAVGYEEAPNRITAEQAAAAAAEANNTSRDSENDGTPKEELALLVDGISLEGLWASDELKIKFVEAVQNIPTVIACRVSPLQKAALVRMIKASPEAPVTLAIGDGANDVGMIHESRVGVGISGKEGRHAANSADFAISQFSFIITLMFHHGRFNYIRCSKLVLYSFFKNLLIVSLLFYYCTYSGFSGTMPMDSIVFSGYNFYLGLPILAVAALDFDIPREDVLKFPRLAYATGRNGEMLNLKNMTKWCIFAFLQGLLLFVIAIRFIGGPSYITSSSGAFTFDIYGTGINTVGEGWGMGLYPEGFLLYSVAVVAMQYKVVAMAVTPNYIFWSLWVLSFLGYILFVYLYGLFPTLDWYNTVPLALGQPLFWLAVLLIPLAMAVSDYIVEFVWSVRDPSSRDELLIKLADEERMRSREKDRSSCTNGVVMRTLSNTSAAQRPPSMH